MSQPLVIKRNRQIGRKRRAVGWTLLALGVLAAGVWVWSGSFYLRLNFSNGSITVGRGLLSASIWDHNPLKPGRINNFGNDERVIKYYDEVQAAQEGRVTRGRYVYSTRPHSWRICWLAPEPPLLTPARSLLSDPQAPDWNAYLASRWSFLGRNYWSAVLWPIPLLLWTPAALFLRSGTLARQRAMQGMCTKCGYSLAGLAKDVACPECGKGAAAT